MTFAQLDDRFEDHPKFIEYGAAEMGLIACGITYANRNLTDGVLPKSWPVRRFGPEIAPVVERLVREGVWERLPSGEYRIVGFLDHNRSKAEIMALRAAKAAAGKRGGKASWDARASKTEAPASSPAVADAEASVEAPASPPAKAAAEAAHVAPAEASAEPRSTTDPRSSSPGFSSSSQDPDPTTPAGESTGPTTGMPTGSRARRLPPGVVAHEAAFWIAAYERGAEAALGHRWGFDREEFGVEQRLATIVATHCQDKARSEQWLEAAVKAFVSAVDGDDKWLHGLGPKGLLKWLNGRKASRQAPRQPPAPPEKPTMSPAQHAEQAAKLEQLLGGIGKGGDHGGR